MYRLLPSQDHNLHTIRTHTLSEISGSLGDLGTLLPIFIALTITGSINPSTTLVFTGLSNIFSGFFFSVPLPVQPMKAIAAVAISRELSKTETASAGLFVAGIVGALSVSGLLNWIGRVVPIPIVKGIQIGAGLSLVLSAGATQLQTLGWITPTALDNLFWAVGAFLFLLAITPVSARNGVPRIPYALIVTIVGVVVGTITLFSDFAGKPLKEPPSMRWQPEVLYISWLDFRTGALTAGIGQLPLTVLNSIIAVTHLSAELLPDVSAPTPTALGLSVAAMNLIACPFGGMPTCHGSGGLAGQYRFGARSGASIIILGVVKLLLGLVVAEAWLVAILERFPKALLGIMVLAAGIELAKVGEGLNVRAKDLWEKAEDEDEDVEIKYRELGEQERKDRWMVMMITVAGLLAFKNDAVGFIAGLLAHVSVHAPKWYRKWRRCNKFDLQQGYGGERPDETESLLHEEHNG